PRDAVDVNLTEDEALGRGPVDVARADDLVDARYRLRTVGERSDRLRATCIDHGGDARQMTSREHLGAGVGTGQHDVLHTRDASRNGRHQDAGGVVSLTARRVDAGALYG